MEVLTWCSIPSPMVIDALHMYKIDGVIIDLEHGMINWETIANLAYQNHNLYVRINYPIDEKEINYAMELNVQGIFVPHVENISVINHVESVVSNKGLSPYTKCMDYGYNLSPDYIQRMIKIIKDDFKVIYMIEGHGIKHLDNIFGRITSSTHSNKRKVYIGSYDLSKYLGVAGDITGEKVVTTMREIMRASIDRDISIGTYARDAKDVKFWDKFGMDFIAMGSDIGYMVAKYKEELGKI